MNDKQLVSMYRRSKTLPEGVIYADVYAAAKRIGKPFKGRPPAAAIVTKVKASTPMVFTAGTANRSAVSWTAAELGIESAPTELYPVEQTLKRLRTMYQSAATKIDAALAALNGAAK